IETHCGKRRFIVVNFLLAFGCAAVVQLMDQFERRGSSTGGLSVYQRFCQYVRELCRRCIRTSSLILLTSVFERCLQARLDPCASGGIAAPQRQHDSSLCISVGLLFQVRERFSINITVARFALLDFFTL